MILQTTKNGTLLNKYNYNIDFYEGVRVQIFGEGDEDFNIEIRSNVENNFLIYKDTIKPGTFVKTPITYYQNWQIIITHNKDILVYYNINLKNENVIIIINNNSLDYILPWIPYIEEFRKLHDCNIYCATFNDELFKKEYNKINFIDLNKNLNDNIIKYIKEYTDNLNVDVYCIFYMGWFTPWKNIPIYDKNNNIIKYIGINNINENKKISLQKTATDCLGLPYKEIKPLITLPKKNEKPINDKYVCINTYDNLKSKLWNYKNGWQELINWLNNTYKVINISEKGQFENTINYNNISLTDKINIINHCEFFIGLSNYLSWIAWSLNKKVVMISGSTKPFFEFKNNNIRIFNEKVCNGCFHIYELESFNSCPRRQNFECTKKIKPQNIIKRIKNEFNI